MWQMMITGNHLTGEGGKGTTFTYRPVTALQPLDTSSRVRRLNLVRFFHFWLIRQ